MRFKSDVIIEAFIKDPNIRVLKSGKILKKDRFGKWIKATISKTSSDYSIISYKGKSFFLHRLIYRFFSGKINSDNPVNHKDGNPSNNAYCNLENISQSENASHSSYSGLNSSHKINYKIAEKMRAEVGLDKFQIAKKYKVRPNLVYDVLRNSTWCKNGRKPRIYKKSNESLNDAILKLVSDPRYVIKKNG